MHCAPILTAYHDERQLMMKRHSAAALIVVLVVTVFSIHHRLLVLRVTPQVLQDRNNVNENEPRTLTTSGESFRKKTPFKHIICGDWTPYGNLGNPKYDGRYKESLDASSMQGCPATQVGTDYLPDPSSLHCTPSLTAFNRTPAILALDYQRSLERPEFAVVSPSYNVVQVLNKTVPTICENTIGKWEIVFVLDACYDESLQVIRNILLSDVCAQSSLMRARVLIAPTSIFETSSDNLGFSLADPSHFYVEVQADMFLLEKGWNVDLARPFLEYSDMFSMSGRCAHGQPGHAMPHVGRCGKNVGSPSDEKKNETMDSFFIAGTNNRGPLMFRADMLRRLGFLDEVNFYLGSDDHDVNRRAAFLGLKAGYKYTHFYAPLDLSPSRNPSYKQNIPEHIKKQEKVYKKLRESSHNGKCEPKRPLDAYDPRTLAGTSSYERGLRPMDNIAQGELGLPELPRSSS